MKKLIRLCALAVGAALALSGCYAEGDPDTTTSTLR